jgi:hypothetical protein
MPDVEILHSAYYVDWAYLGSWAGLSLIFALCFWAYLQAPERKITGTSYNIMNVGSVVISLFGVASLWPAIETIFEVGYVIPFIWFLLLLGIVIVGVIIFLLTSYFPRTLLNKRS